MKARTLLLAALPLPACGLFGPTEPQDELTRNRRLWERQGIDDYEVVFRNLCFCAVEAIQPVRLRVRDGAVIAVHRADDGAAVDPEHWRRYMTVEEAFDFIEDSREGGAEEVRVTYHPEMGYPTHVFVDVSERLADEERTVELSDLRPTETP